jgi:hypothetical protein
MISTFARDGLIMARTSVYYLMAQDEVFFKKAAKLNKTKVSVLEPCGQSVCGLNFHDIDLLVNVRFNVPI